MDEIQVRVIHPVMFIDSEPAFFGAGVQVHHIAVRTPGHGGAMGHLDKPEIPFRILGQGCKQAFVDAAAHLGPVQSPPKNVRIHFAPLGHRRVDQQPGSHLVF